MKAAAMQKKISLNRMIESIILVSGSLVMLILVYLETYIIVDYQNTIRSAWQAALNGYEEELQRSMEAVNANMFEIYSYDKNFDALRTLEGSDCLSDGYWLGERLRTLELYEKRNLSYVLYYDNMKQKKYYFNQRLYRNSDIEAVKKILDQIVGMDNQMNMWSYMEINQRPYAICIYRSGHVALCEICNLSEIKERLKKELDKSDAEVCFLYNGKVLENGGQEAHYEGEYHILEKQVGNTELWIRVCIPADIWTYMNLQSLVLVLLILILIALEYRLYRWIRKELLVPLKQTADEMMKIGEGNVDLRIGTTSDFEELQHMIETINRMTDEIRKQKMISYEQTIEKQQAQMQYLTLQLKPHFYLNGLKTLNVLAINGENEKLQDMILKLSVHLRYLLQAEQQLVPLKDEIICVNNYAELQCSTTERAMKIDWQVDVGQKEWWVPNLCIQTFVENSFKYAQLGSAQRELKIQIRIQELTTEEGIFLDLYICDNGEGYPAEVLEVINQPYVKNSRCVGINNLKRRCDILYGGKFEYCFGNDPGAMSNLILPWECGEVKERKTG